MGLPGAGGGNDGASLVLFLLKLSESDKSLNRYEVIILPILMLLIATLMMSTVRYPSGKQVDMQTKTRLRTFVLMMVAIGLIVVFKEIAFLGLCLGYIFFGLVRHWRRPRSSIVSH